MSTRVTLEQWRAFLAVVEAGGYGQAAGRVHKAQSSVSYAVQRIEEALSVRLFEKQGRKAVLTPAGQVLHRRARLLVEQAERLERGAVALGPDWDPEIGIAVEVVFPTWALLQSLERFGAERPQTRIELYETVLGGAEEALLQRRVDLALTPHLPQGFAGDPLLRVRFIPAAHPDHALHRLQRPLTMDDLRDHRHVLVRDSAVLRERAAGSWLGADQVWTVTNKATQIAAVCRGMGFAWFPEHAIREELESHRLAPLPMREGTERFAEVYLVFADPDNATPSARRLAEILREDVAALCREEGTK